MNRATLRRKATTWAILLGCGFAIVSCELEKVAGSSVTTGNPTEIQVGFTGESGPVAVAGRVEIYGATQIPISGFRPEPLKRYDVDGKSFTLTPSHFEGIADSLWPAGSMDGDTLVRFNLVITGEAIGSILRGLSYRPKASDFVLATGLEKSQINKVSQVEAGITQLVEIQTKVNPKSLVPERSNYLFLHGTGYAALSDSGVFVFTGVPAGTYQLGFISLPNKNNITSKEDSVSTYSVSLPIVAGKVDTLSVADEQARLPMPAEYQPK